LIVPVRAGRLCTTPLKTLLPLLLLLLVAFPLAGQEKSDEKRDEKPKVDDVPSFRIGALLFTDFTYTQEPTSRDVDGNLIHPSSFNVSRAYINVFGTLNHLVSFRITPESSRETGSGSSLSGSQTYRLKYAYGQFNLDPWLTKGSFVRAGVTETPFVAYEESIYRYRFQGMIMVDREGYLFPSDVGVSFHYNLPGDYGDLHAGVYNGEGFAHSEANNEKAFEVRATLRPMPQSAILKGLRLTGYYQLDNYVAHGARNRAIGQVTFEHPRVNAGIDLVSVRDRHTSREPEVEGRGYSAWATPRLAKGWELLLRHDQLKRDRNADSTRRRDIEGIAYWLPVAPKAPLAAAVMLDRDALRGSGGPVTNYGAKLMISF
jgi:hypothetical protein